MKAEKSRVGLTERTVETRREEGRREDRRGGEGRGVERSVISKGGDQALEKPRRNIRPEGVLGRKRAGGRGVGGRGGWRRGGEGWRPSVRPSKGAVRPLRNKLNGYVLFCT